MHHHQHRHQQHGSPFSQFIRPFLGGWRRPKHNVPMNVEDHGDHYKVIVYAVSFDKADIKISVLNDQLIIQGTRAHDTANDPNFLLQEYPLKSFERALPLSNRVDTTGIVARQENSVLILTVPKKPEVVVEVS
ncbi:Hsp20/alpha crystallin family protein [uncultured Fibrella sp.]|uniref:Hsp20/alpha crystallin family protein n=1 Tax=uncultured Fibrella sp. TaxID=1284596 RepID=UPI0035C9D26E